MCIEPLSPLRVILSNCCVLSLGLFACCSSGAGSGPDGVTPWVPPSEEARHRLEGFRSHLRRAYPTLGLETKNELWETALAYVQSLGLDPDSGPGTARLEDVLSSLIPRPDGSNGSRWLLKASIRRQSGEVAHGQDAQATLQVSTNVFFGAALVTNVGSRVDIVIHSSDATLAFSGRVGSQRVRGKIQLSAGALQFSGTAQGTMTSNRIVLTGRERSRGRVALGDFILLR